MRDSTGSYESAAHGKHGALAMAYLVLIEYALDEKLLQLGARLSLLDIEDESSDFRNVLDNAELREGLVLWVGFRQWPLVLFDNLCASDRGRAKAASSDANVRGM